MDFRCIIDDWQLQFHEFFYQNCQIFHFSLHFHFFVVCFRSNFFHCARWRLESEDKPASFWIDGCWLVGRSKSACLLSFQTEEKTVRASKAAKQSLISGRASKSVPDPSNFHRPIKKGMTKRESWLADVADNCVSSENNKNKQMSNSKKVVIVEMWSNIQLI